MTAPPPEPPKPGDPSPYASLRPSAQLPAEPTHSPGFTVEMAKLQELRDALWEAFKAGPDAGLPTILIELTNSYTNSLRVQLNLKSLNMRRRTGQSASVQQASSTKKSG